MNFEAKSIPLQTFLTDKKYIIPDIKENIHGVKNN